MNANKSFPRRVLLKLIVLRAQFADKKAKGVNFAEIDRCLSKFGQAACADVNLKSVTGITATITYNNGIIPEEVVVPLSCIQELDKSPNPRNLRVQNAVSYSGGEAFHA